MAVDTQYGKITQPGFYQPLLIFHTIIRRKKTIHDLHDKKDVIFSRYL